MWKDMLIALSAAVATVEVRPTKVVAAVNVSEADKKRTGQKCLSFKGRWKVNEY